jgi:hypothetical protein
MKYFLSVSLAAVLLLCAYACSPASSPEGDSGGESPSASPAPSSQEVPAEPETGEMNVPADFDFSLSQDRYLFFTAGDPESIFEIASGDVFAGWTADSISFAGEDAGPDPVNLRASFSGSVPLTGEIVIYQDLSGSEGAWLLPDGDSQKRIPRFYGEDPENLYTLELEGENIPAALRQAFGEPQVRERVLGEETFSETFYPDCAILASSLSIQYGCDTQGRPAIGTVYNLTAALDENG